MSQSNQDLTEEQKCVAVATLCKALGVSLEMLPKISDLLSEEGPEIAYSNEKSRLTMPSLKVLRTCIGIKEEDYNKLKLAWEQLGPFKYDDYFPQFGDHTEEITQVTGRLQSGVQWIYRGQVVPGTDIFQGKGIKIYSQGQLEEGYWLDGMQHGKARYILQKGSTYEGDFKLGLKHGYGEYSYPTATNI